MSVWAVTGSCCCSRVWKGHRHEVQQRYCLEGQRKLQQTRHSQKVLELMLQHDVGVRKQHSCKT